MQRTAAVPCLSSTHKYDLAHLESAEFNVRP
jgi:hypothetical protein